MRKSPAILLALLLAISAAATVAHAERCGDAADAVLFRVTSWRSLAAFWETYPGCDDGYFGEHISDLVSTWLSRPGAIARLTRASRSHPTLMPLVLRNINELTSKRQREAIRRNADRRCPDGSQRVCEQILQRIKKLDR